MEHPENKETNPFKTINICMVSVIAFLNVLALYYSLYQKAQIDAIEQDNNIRSINYFVDFLACLKPNIFLFLIPKN